MTDAILLGFDPGRDKCGIAVLAGDRLLAHQILPAGEVGETIGVWRERYPSIQIVMGNQTTSSYWERHLRELLPGIDIVLIDERNSSLEARDRYWQMYPARGFAKVLPKGMRLPPRPVDDIVAILLVERYRQLQTQEPTDPPAP